MNKSLLIIAFLLFSFSKLFSQDVFQRSLDDFHYVLAFTYHPMADDSNFTPIRKRSTELATLADSLEKALDAVKAGNGKLEQAVEQLTEQCKALDDVIRKNATDAVIFTRLSAIHTKFHEIEETYESFKE